MTQDRNPNPDYTGLGSRMDCSYLVTTERHINIKGAKANKTIEYFVVLPQ